MIFCFCGEIYYLLLNIVFCVVMLGFCFDVCGFFVGLVVNVSCDLSCVVMLLVVLVFCGLLFGLNRLLGVLMVFLSFACGC